MSNSCEFCNESGLGTFPNECPHYNGTGQTPLYDNTKVLEWFLKVDEKFRHQDEYIKRLERLIKSVFIEGQGECVKQHVLNREWELEPTENGGVRARLTDTGLTIEEDIAKDIIE